MTRADQRAFQGGSLGGERSESELLLTRNAAAEPTCMTGPRVEPQPVKGASDRHSPGPAGTWTDPGTRSTGIPFIFLIKLIIEPIGLGGSQNSPKEVGERSNLGGVY